MNKTPDEILSNENPEPWMRGPVEEVPALLQPVAHALIQVNEEVAALLKGVSQSQLWVNVAGMASVAFHVKHICGVIDRMFTYANQNPLSEQQLHYLDREAEIDDALTAAALVEQLDLQVRKAINELKHIPEASLMAPRGIGRKKIPTTLIGLLFHAAEHSQRHFGQLLVTVKIVQAT